MISINRYLFRFFLFCFSFIVISPDIVKGQTTCPNSDFDLGNFNDWIGCYGTFTMMGSKPVLSPCVTRGFAPNRRCIIMTGPGYYDSYTCDSLITVFPGDSYSARLGDTSGGGNAEELEYRINVTSANYLFIYRYAVVLESPNHSVNQQPGFSVQINDSLGNVLDSTCGYYLFYSPTCDNPPNCPTSKGWHYCPHVGNAGDGCYWKDWTTVGMNLSAYVGQTIQVVFITHGCAYTAHRGYAYISAFCSYLTLQTSMCEGDSSATLTAPPGFARYNWSTGDTVKQIVVPHPVTGENISCVLTAINGCRDTILETLTYTEITTNFNHGAACSGDSTQFYDSSYVNQNAVTGWIWNFGDGTPIVTGNPNPKHIFALPGTYNVKLVSNSTEGCKDSITKAVTVDALPIPSLTGTTNICKGFSATYTTGAGNSNYTWTVSSGGTITGGGGTTNNTVTVLWNTTGTDTVQVNYVSPTGCTASLPTILLISVNPLPTATISGTTAVCQNATSPLITFTGASSTPPYTFTYNINGGVNQNVTTVTGNSVTVAAPTSIVGSFSYNLISVRDGSSASCSQLQSGSAVVTVNPLPTATISGTTAVCKNAAAPLITFTGASSTPPYTFTYNINGGTNQNVTTVTGNSVTVAAPTNVVGSFSYNLVSVRDGSPTLCSQLQTGSAVVTVNPLPTATISGTTAVCQNAALPLITFTGASSTPPYTFTYNINGGTNQNVTTVTGNSVTVAAPTNIVGTYTYNLLSVQDGSPTLCSQSQSGSAVITVNPLPTATISGTTAVCQNAASPLITFTGASSTPPYTITYNINGGINQNVTTGTGNSVTIAAPTNIVGSFSYNLVSVRDGSSTLCSQTQTGSAVITVNPLPTATITGTTAVCKNAAAPLITFTGASSTPPYTFTYNINGGTNQNVTTVTGNSVTLAAPTNIVGSFSYNLVSVRDGSPTSCSQLQTGSVVVTVNPLPTATISGTTAVCQNAASPLITFTGASSTPPYTFTYNINGGTNQNVTTSAGNSVTVAAPTNTAGSFVYNLVSVQDGSPTLCSQVQTGSATVTINPLPVPSISGPGAVCPNSSATYSTETGMSNYNWSVSAGGSITSGTGTSTIIILWNTIGTKTITVNYINGNGCTAAVPSSYSVNVNSLPLPSLTGLNTLCSGLSAVYTTDAGMNNYSWTVSAGGTIIAGGGTSDNTVTVLWNTASAQTVSVNYVMGTGCTAPTPTVYNVTVKPRPSVTNAANSALCSSGTTSIVPTANLSGTTFIWTATGSSGNVSGYSNGAGSSIIQTLVNSGFSIETVNYAVTPSLNGCDGAIANYIVTVNPVPDVYFNPNGQSFCSGGKTNITLLSHVAGATFTWTATGSSENISGFGPGSGSLIAQTLTNSDPYPDSVNYDVSPLANSCAGTDNHVIVEVSPMPQVSFTPCNDVITTTDAKAFILKGGIPLGGVYSGAGVNAGIFYPGLACPGTFTINYSYTNNWGCNASESQTISVISAVSFSCDNILTDIRDNQQYPTVKLGTQCWMAKNLNYGTIIASTSMQRDNCVSEKYCFEDNVANCSFYGGLYQWDELMQYDNTAAEQGFCPPAWHIPTNNDWTTLFGFYISNGFAGSPLKYTGYSGFNAFLSGTRFNNVNWNFSNFAVMFWTSTMDGPQKAWAHGMNTYNPSVSDYPSSRTHAFNVRCIKD